MSLQSFLAKRDGVICDPLAPNVYVCTYPDRKRKSIVSCILDAEKRKVRKICENFGHRVYPDPSAVCKQQQQVTRSLKRSRKAKEAQASILKARKLQKKKQSSVHTQSINPEVASNPGVELAASHRPMHLLPEAG